MEMGQEEIKIKKLENDKKEIDKKIGDLAVILGEELSGVENSALDVPPFRLFRKNISEAHDRIKENTETSELITSLLKKHSEIGKTKGAAKSNIRSLIKENSEFYEVIGRAAYDNYKKELISNSELDTIFLLITEKTNEMKALENKIEAVKSKNSKSNSIPIIKLSPLNEFKKYKVPRFAYYYLFG